MCGITGFCDYAHGLDAAPCGDCARLVQDMGLTLRHRGPDAFDTFMDANAAFAHARLAVVDLSGGAQPMTRRVNGCEYTIVYNGELYNAQQVREELLSAGYELTTRSDTEVLLYAYIHYADACAGKLNGIFAFAVNDTRRGCCFLCRDRFGVKPLFYAQTGGRLVFGSEIKALLAYPGIEPRVERDGLCEVFGLGPARTPGHGVFKGINELQPGWCAVFDAEGLRTWRYWALESREHEDDYEKTVSTVRALLIDSVERQLVSDIPLCTFLSGGLDSSLITAVAADVCKRDKKPPIDTFSFDFTGNEHFFKANDYQPDADAPWVRAVSAALGTKHQVLECGNYELAARLENALHARDLPGMADIDASLLHFCNQVSWSHRVALSGECADEIFGGYPWFHQKQALESACFPWSPALDLRESLLRSEVKDWLRLQQYADERYAQWIEKTPRLPGEDAQEARRREIGFLNIQWFMSVLLERKDRMSMASGLEVRVPFADHRLAQYVFNVPWRFKCPNGAVKGLLRDAAQGMLPPPVLARKKSPYPKTHNPGYALIVRQKLAQVMDDSSAPIHRLVDAQAVRALLEAPDDCAKPFFGQLMAAPQLMAWLWQINLWLSDYKISF